MKKKLLIIVLVCLFQNVLFSQEKVKGNIVSKLDSISLSVLQVYPDSFPNVSIVFRAETKNGEPLWDLDKRNLLVNENSEECELIKLTQISNNKRINLAIVIDHSGSMMEDYSQLYDKKNRPLYHYDAYFNIVLPKGYTQPIDNAKKAVINFVKGFDISKDYISVIGFSDSVDFSLPLTQDLNQINRIVDSMEATNSTALYNAMYEGLNQLENTGGISVMIALTDGQDNSSSVPIKAMIEKAKQTDIPIYIVGLGEVQANTLDSICNSTNGKFYYTKSSNSLDSIYQDIRRNIQAYYDLLYVSANLSSMDTTRNVELVFSSDSLQISDMASFNLPQEVKEYLIKKETTKMYTIYGCMFVAVVLLTGILIYRRKKQRKEPENENSNSQTLQSA